jgi:hypothetical protein
MIGGGTPNMTIRHAAADQAGACPYQRRTTERLVQADRVKKPSRERILSDRSDSQIAENPERVRTAQGC